jgi:ABC-type spermidine/putrescine transport system permease subunit II
MDNVGVEGRVFYTMLFSLKRYFSVLSGSEVEVILTSVAVVVAVVVVAEIISTRVAVVVGRGGDYLDTSSSSSSSISGDLLFGGCPVDN